MSMSGGFGTIGTGVNKIRAYVSRAVDPKTAAVVIHDWWGLDEDCTRCVDRLAQGGIDVIAPDLYGGKNASNCSAAGRLAFGLHRDAVDAVRSAVTSVVGDPKGERRAITAIMGIGYGAAVARDWAARDSHVRCWVVVAPEELPSFARENVVEPRELIVRDKALLRGSLGEETWSAIESFVEKWVGEHDAR